MLMVEDITCYKTINLIQPLLIEQLLLCNLTWNGISFESNAILHRVMFHWRSLAKWPSIPSKYLSPG